MYALGYDLGSSSIKAALVDIESSKIIAHTSFPKNEMPILSNQAGWAEQHPGDWWSNLKSVTEKLLKISAVDSKNIKCIGIAYQMHGLVAVDSSLNPVRPAIIWCDSRAVKEGNKAFKSLGERFCLEHFLNSPGNFTASKLAWVQKNETALFTSIYKIMLPGDYIAAKLTGKICTTIPGLSEGILWDFKNGEIATQVLDYFNIPESYLPDIVPGFGFQGNLTQKASEELGLEAGTVVAYRAGDQPNNALSLNVLQTGEIAATGGTSGVIYAVTDELIFDEKQRVNSFAHINYTSQKPRIGVLLCINGAGIMYKWIRESTGLRDIPYPQLEKIASVVEVGSEGVKIFPFGNGAERMFQNKNLGVQIKDIELNRHSRSHLIRAALEGIAFSFIYGVHALQSIGMKINKMRVGNDNLFQSHIFSNTISNVLNIEIEVIATTGAAGAAFGAAYGAGYIKTLESALSKLEAKHKFKPAENREKYVEAYNRWEKQLEIILQAEK